MRGHLRRECFCRAFIFLAGAGDGALPSVGMTNRSDGRRPLYHFFFRSRHITTPLPSQDLCLARPTFDAALSALQVWFDTGPAEEDDEGRMSLTELLGRLATDPIDQALLKAVFFPLFGADPLEVSARAIREEMRCIGGDVHPTLAGEDKWFDRTAGAIAVCMSAELPPERLILSCPVTSVVVGDDDGDGNRRGGAAAWVGCGDGNRIRAGRVLLVVPVAVLHSIDLEPNIPCIGPEGSARMNAGRVVKLWARATIRTGGAVAAAILMTRLHVGHSPLRLLRAMSLGNGEYLLSAQALAEDAAGRDPLELFAETCPPGLAIREAEAKDWPADPYVQASWMAEATREEHAGAVFAGNFGPLHVIGVDSCCGGGGAL
jgi:hypothetical protein